MTDQATGTDQSLSPTILAMVLPSRSIRKAPIELVREIPEAMKPRKIAVGGTQPKHDQIEAKAEKADTKEPVDA